MLGLILIAGLILFAPTANFVDWKAVVVVDRAVSKLGVGRVVD